MGLLRITSLSNCDDVTAGAPCSEGMDLASLRQDILTSNKTASEKAEAFLRKSRANVLSKDEWRNFIAGIPEEVEEEVCNLTAGTHPHLRMDWTIQVSNWLMTAHTSMVACLS